ncbi:MAG: hypothetical protein AB1744_02910 [Candidatus Zixiibacteriota bacterium]
MRAWVSVAVFAVLLAGAPALAYDDHPVQGYMRRDGVYVQPHMRTSPDNTPWNNFGTQGNINPYTGQPGRHDPYSDSLPSYQSPSYRDQGRLSNYGRPLYRP